MHAPTPTSTPETEPPLVHCYEPRDASRSEDPVLRRMLGYLGRYVVVTNPKSHRKVGKLVTLPSTCDMSGPTHLRYRTQGISHFIVIDVDRPEGGAIWIEQNLPRPTILIMNPKSGHAQYWYELQAAVCLSENGRIKIQEFYHEVTEYLTAALGGDAGFTGYIARNPFHRSQRVAIIDRTFTLAELAHAARVSLGPQMGRFRETATPHDEERSRRKDLFDHLRKHAYQCVHHYATKKSFANYVNTYLRKTVQPKVESEYNKGIEGHTLRSVAKSVTNHVWRYRDAEGRYCYTGCRSRPSFQSSALMKAAHDKADRTKISQSIDRMEQAARQLLAVGQPLTKKGMASTGLLSVKTIQRHSAAFDLIVSRFSASHAQNVQIPKPTQLHALLAILLIAMAATHIARISQFINLPLLKRILKQPIPDVNFFHLAIWSFLPRGPPEVGATLASGYIAT